jgi:8-oxo-dGTP pyrophosphatase MutT (NUDIX family)
MNKDEQDRAGWKELDNHLYEAFPIFSFFKSRRVNPRTGKPHDFVRIEGLDWANVIPVTPDNQVVLIRQYRHGSESFTIEIPGGCVEKGENPAAAVIRELREETGYTANPPEFLGTIHPNPALQSNLCHLFIARNATLVQQQALDAGEDITVFLRPFEEVIEMIKRGEISHAMVIAAFGMLALNRMSP